MFASGQYQLLDFGAGRKLERFGPYVFDRPSPAAQEVPRRNPEAWRQVTARFDRLPEQAGTWSGSEPLPEPWSVVLGPLHLELKLTEFGQVGLFPEHASNWDWIAEQVRQFERPKVLNLFAYTGGSTLFAARAGAEVVHVDAAAGVVAWARRNAEASQLSDAPIRWIVEDAVKFVRRELKRGNRYDVVLLDPPAYGHGPRGQSWKLEIHLAELLSLCLQLCNQSRASLLVTCHSGKLAQPDHLSELVEAQAAASARRFQTHHHAMNLKSSAGGILPCGAAVRVTLTQNTVTPRHANR